MQDFCLFEIKKRINYYTKNPLGLTGNFIVMNKTVSKNAVPYTFSSLARNNLTLDQGAIHQYFCRNKKE